MCNYVDTEQKVSIDTIAVNARRSLTESTHKSSKQRALNQSACSNIVHLSVCIFTLVVIVMINNIKVTIIVP